MSNNCYNELEITGELSEQAERNINGVLDSARIKNEAPHWCRQSDGYWVRFTTHWSPPIDQTHTLQRLFSDLTFELHFYEPMGGLYGRVLPDGRLREDVTYGYVWSGDMHDLGHRIWDAAGNVLLEDRSRPVPLHLRISAWFRYKMVKPRRALRTPAIVEHDDSLPL